MTLRTDKDLKSKNFRGKKSFILAKDINSKRNLKSKPKNCLVHHDSDSCFQNTLLQNFLFTKY